MANITKEDVLKIRRLYGLSQYDMAHMLEISQSAVFKIEKGYMDMSEKIAGRLVERFNLTPDRIALIRGIYAEFNNGRPVMV